MTQLSQSKPSFNLWTEAWITVERPSGGLDVLNIQQTLAKAHHIRALYEPSPLIVVAIHRLLVAILQAVIRPQTMPDLSQVWRERQFSAERLQAFADQYGHRFDLFSEDTPFLQSADLSLQAAKGDNVKAVGYLLSEQPAGTAVTHYTHAYDSRQQLCSRCAAKGLLTIPAFALSGGSGIKPSINGEPPVYMLPGGETLFESLTASLTIPRFQPGRPDDDQPWWEHKPVVPKKAVVKRVGYLHSLTFPARRVRLHPTPGQSPCTRCGQTTPWHVATMVYEMGESRPKEAAWWRDPFVGYRKPKDDKEAKQPKPIRPVEGRAVWREFTGLFLPTRPNEKGHQPFRPAILDQLEDLKENLPYEDNAPIPLRTISLRHQGGQMKIFEWQESGFVVPPRLLTDLDSARHIENGIDFAVTCDGIIKGTFRDYFGGKGKEKRFKAVNRQMSQRYWQQLGHIFQGHIQQYTAQAEGETLFRAWLGQVIHQAIDLFQQTVDTLPDDGATLRRRVEAINHCRAKLYGFRNKTYPQEEAQ